jgi:hypothetical protein
LQNRSMDKKDDLSHIDQILIDWASHVRAFREDLGFSVQQWQKISLRVEFDEMVQASDNQVSAAVDAILTDLDIKHRKIVEHIYLGHVWEMSGNKDKLLEEAQSEIANRLKDRGFYVSQKDVA